MAEQHNYTQKFQFGKFTVEVSPSTKYGYFEHDELGDERGGGLWFEMNDEQKKLELVDYDGVFALPKPVAKGLVEQGYYLDPESYEDELA